MDFQSAIETFAEAWVAAYTQTPLTEAAETQGLLLDMNREKVPEGAPEASLRSPGSSSTALVEFRPKPPPLQPSGRAIPVHCVVEQVSPQGQSIEGPPAVVLEDYAIIPSNTPFSELVRTALAKLGYSSPEALDAKGAIQLKNWKPLTFEQITESPEATVGDILYEVSTVATLRIRLYSRPKTHSANDVKEKLLQVLLAQSQNLLVSSGCPIDLVSSVLAALTKGRLECDIPDETRKKFDQWYLQQVFQHCRQVALLQQHVQQPPPAGPPPPQPAQAVDCGGGPGSPAAPEPRGPRTRNRTSFDPELELPKLHRWFAENQHPSRLQIQQYVRELNSLESRRGRKPLDVNNVVYWFKNARAAHKRAEQKCCAESNGRGGGSSDDSDNAHTLDLSVRRACECVVKEEPRDSSSEHSLESSDSGDEMEVNVMEEPRTAQNGAAEFRLEERRKRNRTFIDPVSEVPRLEQWFSANTHPSQGQIVRFTNELNSMQYRQKFPKLEPKNIQFWFKNRRAKCKRLNLAANLSEKMLLPPDKMLQLPTAAAN